MVDYATGKSMDKPIIQVSERSHVFGYTNKEYYEIKVGISMELKQACSKHLSSRKVHHPGHLINAIGPKKHYSMALLIGTIQNFMITWSNKGAHYHSMYKRNSMNTLNVAAGA